MHSGQEREVMEKVWGEAVIQLEWRKWRVGEWVVWCSGGAIKGRGDGGG